jgi:hypothetical protein
VWVWVWVWVTNRMVTESAMISIPVIVVRHV